MNQVMSSIAPATRYRICLSMPLPKFPYLRFEVNRGYRGRIKTGKQRHHVKVHDNIQKN